MTKWRNLLVALLIFMVLLATMPGCGREAEPVTDEPVSPPIDQPAPTPAAQELSNQIAGINPAEPGALRSLLETARDLDSAQGAGTISEEEEKELKEDLENKFSGWVKERLDEIDPSDPGALRDFYNMQAVQATSEYDDYCDPATKQYKEEQMENKFNDWVRNLMDDIDPSDPNSLKDFFDMQLIQATDKYDEYATSDTTEYKEEQMTEKFSEWVRNRVDEIDPSDPNSLKDFFDMQLIQATEKYEEFTTADTQQYKEEQMGEKFNEWMRNRVDEIDPSDPDSLKDFFDLQIIQATEKWEEYATPETIEYKEEQMWDKFNEWVRNRADELDPNDPDFLKKLEMLRIIQWTEKYEKFATQGTHRYKEGQISDKFDDFVKNLVDKLNPLLPGFMQELGELVDLQTSDVYQELCSDEMKEYKTGQLYIKLAKEPGGVPNVIGTLPEPGETDVLLNQPLLLAFDQPMEPISVMEAFEIDPAIEGDVHWMEEDIIMLFQPLEPWDFDTTYTIYLDITAMSQASMLLEEGYEFSFTTKEPEEAPRVIETIPFNGQIDAPGSEPIEIHFDQSMEPASTEEAIEISPATDCAVLWLEDNTIAVLQPWSPLESNTNYEVEIHTSALSADMIPLAEGYSFSFITGIVRPPRVMGTFPENGQVDIPSNHPIQIVFDRSMEPASVEVALEVSPAIDYTTTWHEADFVLRIEPLTPLAANTTYTFKISTEATSAAGLPLVEIFSFSFTTNEG